MMLVCVKPLRTWDKYAGEVRLTPGRSHVDSTHEVVRAYPSHFRPASDDEERCSERIRYMPPAAPRTRALPATPRGLEVWRLGHRSKSCRLSMTQHPTPVRLSSVAHASLAGELERAGDGVESGGLLFGGVSRSMLEIVVITGPGPNARRLPDGYGPDVDHDRAQTAAMAERGLARVGEWHSHTNGGGLPSSADLECFESMREQLGLHEYAALLGVRVRGGWTLGAFIVSGSLTRGSYCRPAYVN